VIDIPLLPEEPIAIRALVGMVYASREVRLGAARPAA